MSQDPPEAPEQTPEPSGEEAPRGSPRRRRLLSLLLLVGGVSAAVSLMPHWPKERRVDFRIEEDEASVVRLDVTWERHEADGNAKQTDEIAAGSSFHFEPGQAPKIIHTTVHLPDGSYALDITLERADHTTSIQRTLTLGEADQITVPLR